MMQLLLLLISMAVMRTSLLLFLLRPKGTTSIVKITLSAQLSLEMDVLALALVLITIEIGTMSEVSTFEVFGYFYWL